MTGRWPLGDSSLRDRMAAAVADPDVPGRIQVAVERFGTHRTEGLAELADPDGLRHRARALKASILADLPALVDRLEAQLQAQGATVHRASDDVEASAIVARIAAGKRVVKSKSMATEEIGLNEALEAAGATVVETDLGEWIIQLADQTPSHIIAPAVHHDRHSILEVFERVAGAHGVAAEPTALNAFARTRLRQEFLAAEVGISGVNFAAVDTGSLVLVTNEGNGRLTTSLPPVHVAVLGMERLVRSWAELDLFLTLLTRSATGQRLTSYTNAITGPRRAGEPDGPQELHVVVVDNGRSALLGTEQEEMLGCLRCGACLNVCPVYRQTGGHAYGWVYPGPMGAVLTALLAHGEPGAAELPGASTLCGACMDACPVEIPLQDLLLALRRDRAADGAERSERAAWRAWSEAWAHPASYRASTRVATAVGSRLGDRSRHLPGASRWTEGREAPVPAARSFRSAWQADHGTTGTAAARAGARPPAPGPRPLLDPDGADRTQAHPRPAPTDDVPPIEHLVVDPDDLLGTFARTATEAGARVHVVAGPAVPPELLDRLVREHQVASVVANAEPLAQATAEALEAAHPALAVHRTRVTRDQRVAADLGITSAIALVAATGSLVVDASVAGDRTTSLLPRVHLAVVSAADVAATPGDVWRRYDADPDALPSNLVFVTGPSRTGDIEQLLTVGVHGPTAVEIVVLDA
ncbi:LUD domain-containing protein [Aquihabitans sp. G128]|uniref:LUD domain-containing protein n=1 Tax=Aquihabitans sp. G128 TaxID=2849779 RepID=UPI001C240B8C|nr:LUD domain-containing protein [Aquihabitans sp. G128]QXC62883.1 LUD domain-containing protein [Aquihabitans sp. G128]